MESSQRHRGTRPGAALDSVREQYDRIIVITDEQSHDHVGTPRDSGYVIKSPAREKGVGYGPWTHVDGFSEFVFDYVRELEHAKPAQL
jgi:hypothetical protein